MKQQRLKKATTLIEILLYFAIVGIVTLAGMTFAIQILSLNSQSGSFNELETNLNFISSKMIYTIQTSSGVDLPNSIFDNNQGALSLNQNTSEISPTRFYLQNGDIFVTEGTSSTQKLNSDLVTLNFLRFHRAAYTKAPDQIVIDAEIAIKGSGPDFDKKMPLHLVISLR